jgi:signal transduction histidine kinase
VDVDHALLRTSDTMTTPATPMPPDSILPPRVGRVLLLVSWLAVIYGTAAVVPHVPGLHGIGAWICTLVFLGTFSLVVTQPGAENLLPVSGLAAVALQFLAPSNGAFVAVEAVIAVAGIRLDPRFGISTALLSGGGFLVASMVGVHPLAPAAIVAMVPALLFTYLGATAMRRLRTEQQRSMALLAEVVAGRDAIIRVAALDERAHLARELHDVLAHTLSALSIQLEGTQLLAEQRGCDPAVVTALERAGGLAKEGLGEARRAVGSLRGEVLPGPELLPQLTQAFERDTGVPCRLRLEGAPVVLSSEAGLALYRIAQEALTNVRKHAAPAGVDVTLHTTLEAVELIVENDGTARPSPLPGGGYGVSGMRERAERLQGTFEAGPTATGYRVKVWIPTQTSSSSAS